MEIVEVVRPIADGLLKEGRESCVMPVLFWQSSGKCEHPFPLVP